MMAPMFKFTPLYAFAQDTFNTLEKPQNHFKEADGISNLEIMIQKYNLISSDFITMIITEDSEHSTNNLHRIFSEYYLQKEYGYQFKI